MRTRPLLAVLGFLIAAPAVAMEGYGQSATSCDAPPEGYGAVGPGWIRLTETLLERKSPKRELGDGWFEADFSFWAEDEILGQQRLRVRITPDLLSIRFLGDGTRIDWQSCAILLRNG